MTIETGKVLTLVVARRADFGVYLSPEEGSSESVLLPQAQVPAGTRIGDEIEVFIYRDSQDRLISTTRMPKLKLGEVAVLKVAQTNRMGAFMDWGLEKDLFLPFREQTRPVKEGESFPVALYVDKSGRLCATMKLYHYLRTDSPYQKEDMVTGTLYEISERFGAFVAVDNIYSGLIPAREVMGGLRPGQEVECRVTAVREDGKLTLSARPKAYLVIEKDAEKVMETIMSFDGALPFNDKSSPEVIRREMDMSKAEFKRAVGHLLKEGRIRITERSILAVLDEN